MRASLKMLLVVFVPSVLTAQAMPVRPVNWPMMQDEAVEVLREYLRINTTNPTGNELETARFLEAFLDKERIEAQILDTVELGKGRANLRNTISVTVLQGSNKTNVIPAEASAELDIRLLPDQEPDSVRNDERLAVSNVGPGVKFVYDILRYAQ